MTEPYRNLSSLPVSTELTPAWVRGEMANRLMVILRAPGCAYDLRPKGGCTFCGYRHLTTRGVSVAAANLIAQADTALAGRDCSQERIFEIDLYNSGSFLNDDEVPPEARAGIMARCARDLAVRVVLVESRPEYITAHRIADLRLATTRVQPLALEVGIGLESADDTIREEYLNKGFTRKAFERAVTSLGETGADLLAYVMIKPLPMSDAEAIRDSQRTAEYVRDVAARRGIRARIALEPTFVVPGTPLAKEYAAGRYTPPFLWLVLEVARRIAPMGDLVVGLSDEDLRPLAVPDSCPLCRDRVLATLKRFNLTQAASELDLASCPCVEFGSSKGPRSSAASQPGSR